MGRTYLDDIADFEAEEKLIADYKAGVVKFEDLPKDLQFLLTND